VEVPGDATIATPPGARIARLSQPQGFALCMQCTSTTVLFWDFHIPKQTPVYREVGKMGKPGYHLD